MPVKIEKLRLASFAPSIVSSSDYMFKGKIIRRIKMYIYIMHFRLFVHKKIQGKVSSTSAGFILSLSGDTSFIRAAKGVIMEP